MSVPRKYGFLRIVAFILKLLAWLALLGGVVGAIVAKTPLSNLLQGLNLPAWLPGASTVGVLLICVIWFVQLFVFGSVLSLLIDIEENTRALAGRSE